jgi:hypothetical protein
MDVPEDIREKAKEVRDLMWIHSSPRFAADAIAQALLAERLAQRERDAKTMRHLGNVLQLLAELHPDDRCRALDSALEFFNRETPNGQIEAAKGYVSRLVITGPLQLIP